MADTTGTVGGNPGVVMRDISSTLNEGAGTRYAVAVDVPRPITVQSIAGTTTTTLAAGDAAVGAVEIKDATGTSRASVHSDGGVSARDTWSIVTLSDIVGNDSEKRFAVPAGYEYQVLWIWVEYHSSAIVGNRQLQIDFRNQEDQVIGQIRPGVTQAANLVRYYMIAPALADHGAFRDTDYLMTPMPPTVFLVAHDDIHIWDNNDVSPGGDDMAIRIQVARRAL